MNYRAPESADTFEDFRDRVRVLSTIYRKIYQEHPELSGKSLDSAVLLTLTEAERDFVQSWHLREDALLCIIEDATGATGTLRTDRDANGNRLTGKRRWCRACGPHQIQYPPLDCIEDEVQWLVNLEWAGDSDALEPIEPAAPPRVRGLLTLKYNGCNAYGTLLHSGFILYRGSEILPIHYIPRDTSQFYDRIAYAHLIGPGSIVKKNLIFQSSGIAGSFVAGRQVSSINKWKLADGRSLKDLLP